MNPWIRWPEGTGSWRWLARALGMPALLATPPRAACDMALPQSRLTQPMLEKFAALLGPGGVQCDSAWRLRHAGTAAADRLRLRGGDTGRVPDAVLVPRSENDVLALLRLCDAEGIGVAIPGAGAPAARDAPVVSLDLSAMNRLLALDMVSGLAQVEAGITGTELEKVLSERGVALDATIGEPSLGAWIAGHDARPGWLHDLRLATPRGLATGLERIAPGSRGAFGIITRATVLVGRPPALRERRVYLFPDFAAGLAALREACRCRIVQGAATLSDGAATRFARARACAEGQAGLRWRLDDIRRRLRGFDQHAATLAITFAGDPASVKSHRKQFEALARRLHATAQLPLPDHAACTEALLDRGVMTDSLRLWASWTDLPARYAAVRAALDRAMRASALREDAHGLVLTQVTAAHAQGAVLKFTWLFPRGLTDDLAQAEAVRQAALGAAQAGGCPLAQDVSHAIRRALDPNGILKTDAP